MKRALVALIVGLIGLTACGSAHSLGTAPSSPSVQTSPSDPPASSSPTPKPKPKPTASTPSPKPTQSTGTAACSSSQGGKQVSAQLVDVRVGRHDTYDRVTFEFTRTLSDDGVHPDYHLIGQVERAKAPPAPIEWHSPHHAPVFRATEVYRRLFPE